jgi:hypothetical protein
MIPSSIKLSTAQNLVNNYRITWHDLLNGLNNGKWLSIQQSVLYWGLRVTKKRNPVIYNYKMMGHQLVTVHHYPYPGVELSEDMNWDPHISKVTSKANKTLGFLRRNLKKKCPQDNKESACKSLVRPHLEYVSVVWDPYRQCHINKIEMVQRRAAHFVTSNYSREPGTVTNI